MACRAVSDCKNGHFILPCEAQNGCACLRYPCVRRRRINDAGVKNLSGRVDNGKLAACPIAGVHSEDDSPAKRRLHQKLSQIQPENTNGAFVCRVGQLAAQFPFNRGKDQPVIGIPCRFGNNRGCAAIIPDIDGKDNILKE